MHRDVGEWRHGGSIAPSALSKGMEEVPFHINIIGDFMVYQDRFEINLWQLFGHPDNSE